MCRNGDCILAKKRCDSKQDCLDRSDERACFSVASTIETVSLENVQKIHRAEAFIELGDEENGTTFSLFLLFVLLLVVGFLLLIFCVLRRYPDTKLCFFFIFFYSNYRF